MSRTQEQGINYVPLDVDLFADGKIKILKARYGMDGMMILIYILMMIYREGYYTKFDEDFYFVVADELGITPDKVEQVMTFLLKRSMFNEQLFKSDAILTSTGIQERWQRAIQTRARKTPQCVVPEFWLLDHEHTESWIRLGERGNYTHSEDSSENYAFNSEKKGFNSEKNDTSKSKVKVKVNNTITITPVSGAETGTPAKRAEVTQEDVISYCRSNGYKINPIKFFEYYSKKEWKTKDGKPITDWYALADDWEKKERRKAVRDNPLKFKAESFDTEEFFNASIKNTYGDLSDEVIADLGK